jgi:RNA polymerase sigma factor (sigma-70 family)
MERTRSHGDLLRKARSGDSEAWNALVEQMSPIIWSIARSFRLDHATAKDVAQTVWVKLVENCDRIEDPDRLPGWISTTCRREAMSAVNGLKRMTPSDFEYDIQDPSDPVEQRLIDHEDHDEVRAAFDTLDQSDRELLRLTVLEPVLSYEEISQVTGRPVGSLGPTRARALQRLRRALEATETELKVG